MNNIPSHSEIVEAAEAWVKKVANPDMKVTFVDGTSYLSANETVEAIRAGTPKGRELIASIQKLGIENSFVHAKSEQDYSHIR